MIAPVIIKLNGIVITSDINGLNSFEITYRQSDEEGVLLKSYSNELTFYGQGYNILKTELIDNPQGFIGKVDVEVIDECCKKPIFKGIIRGDSIDWCEPECWISCQIIEDTPALTCIQSTLITDNHDDFLNRPQKKVRYCVEMRPQFITEVLLGLYTILFIFLSASFFPIASVIFVWQSVFYAICLVVCAVAPTCTTSQCNNSTIANPIGVYNQIYGLLDNLADRLIQCQWYHPTALVRDYIENVCRKCGLTFQSSILNDPASPYYNLLLFSAVVRKGYKPSDTESRLIKDNAPIETLDTLMSRHLKPLFNAKYWIINNTLIFERRDYFQNTATWIDSEQLLNDGQIFDNRICFSWIDDKKYAYGLYEYLQDGSDLLAYEAAHRFNRLVEWNDPPSEAQEGVMENRFLSGMARFRDDKAGYEATGFSGLTNFFLFNALADSRDLLLMSQHTAYNYKFLIWDEFSGDDEARIKRDYSNSFTGGDVIGDIYINNGTLEFELNDQPLDWTKLFNYPMWFNENNTNNLYTLFHYINNPRTQGNRLYDFSFKFGFDCVQFDSLDFNKNIRLKIGNQIKFGEIKELKIDFIKRIVDVSGIV